MNLKTVFILACCAVFAPVGALSAAEIFVTANPDNTFTPKNIEINVGDTVTWTNKGGLHNVEAADGSFRCANGCDGDGMGGNGDPASNAWTASVTFTEPGEIDYFCVVHAGFGMTGRIRVVESSDMSLEVVGDCPGTISLSVSGATPNGSVIFAVAAAEGVSFVPVGNCAGTELGLDRPSLLAVLRANGAGEISLTRNINASKCGRWLQAVDGASCAVSNTEQLP